MNKKTASNWILLAITAILLAHPIPAPPSALAADGDRDPDFGAGITFTGIDCELDDRFEMILQPDGCVLVAGIDTDVCVARLLPDGRLDPGFGTGGVARYPVLAEHRAGPGLALQADGRILVAAGRSTAEGRNILIRLLPDGSPDPGFGSGGAAPVPFANSGRTGIAVGEQPDGKILLAFIEESTSQYMLARFESSGPLDISYGVDGVASIGIAGTVQSDVDLIIQTDGKAVIAGTDIANNEGFVARWMTDGTRDLSFSTEYTGDIPHTGVTSLGYGIDLQMRMEGGFRFAGHDGGRNFTVGFVDHGGIDPGDLYQPYGHVAIDQLKAVAIDQASDGTWYLGGMMDPVGLPLGAYVKLSTGDYWHDRTYGNDSFAYTVTQSEYYDGLAMKVTHDGKVFIAAANEFGQGIWVVQIDGYGAMYGGSGVSRRGWVSLGPEIESYSGLALAAQPGGKILAAGHEEIVARNFVTRFDPDGTRDLDFGEGGIAFALPVSRDFPTGDDAWPGLAVLPDGRFFLAGMDSVTNRHFVSRYSADGDLDTSYGDGGVARMGLFAYAYVPLALVAQPSGRAVIASMDLLGQDYYLAGFDASGELDPGFGSGGVIHAGLGTDDNCHLALALQPDGKIILAGHEFDSGLERLVRFTANGQPDPSFGVDGIATWGIGSHYRTQPSLAVQSGGGILLAVHAEALNEVVVVRYTTAGQIDQTFGTGAIARTGLPSDTTVGTALVQESDGKFLLTSWTETFPWLYTARFTADGILDSSFGVGGIARDDQLYTSGENVAAVLSPRGGSIILCQDGLLEQGLLMHLESSTYVSTAPGGPTHADQLIIRSISPNPFSAATSVMFDLPLGTGFNARVFDVRGRRVRSLALGEISRGSRTLSWDGRDDMGQRAAAGVYFFRIEAGDFQETKRMVLIK